MTDKRPPRRLRLIGLALSGGLVLPSVAACSSAEETTEVANCVDANNTVVDPKYCDDPTYYGGGGYFILMAPLLYSSGYRVPSSGALNRINPADSAARVNAGLPGSGKVGGVTVRGGGIGKGPGGNVGGTGFGS